MDNVGENNAVEKQDKTLNLQFIEKSSMDITGEKTMNCCKQTTEKQLGASTSEVLGNTKGKGCFPCVSNQGMGHGGCKWCDEFEKLQEING